MNTEQLNRLKTLLSVPTQTYKEELMVEYICNQLDEMEGVSYYRDNLMNIYITKGELDQDEYYPMFVAHTDTVHGIVPEIVVKEEKLKKPYTYGKTFDDTVHDVLKAYTPSGSETGIGGDDKAGVFIALELLNILPKVKVGLFVSEETGCHGSMHCDVNFLKDVGYAIQFDAPGDHLITRICWGIKLYEDDGEFIKIARSTFEKWMNTTASEQTHPYTDVSQIKDKGDFSCINFSCGYYNMHSNQEFVVIKDVENSISMAEELVNKLGYKKYEHSYNLNWMDYGYYGKVDDLDDDGHYGVADVKKIGDNTISIDVNGLSITDNVTNDLIQIEWDDVEDFYEYLKGWADTSNIT